MRFTLDWLKDHLDTQASAEEISLALTSLGFEVEEVINTGAQYKGFVLGEIIDLKPHPEADKLNLCLVNYGQAEMLWVVCGGRNVRKGLKTIFASVGCVIPESQTVLKKGVIRGVESAGMLCSSTELLLTEVIPTTEHGIIDLETTLPHGTALMEVLAKEFNLIQDTVIEISVTPNRGDAMSVRGIARELAAKGLGTFKPLEDITLDEKEICSLDIIIEDTTGCPYYTARPLKGIENAQSPQWMQNRLKAVGLNSKSLAVDVANYVMWDVGQPLHCFDMEQLSSSIVVGKTIPGTKFQALNDKEYELSGKEVVITSQDRSELYALGGIMGGASSASTPNTKNILIESAYFSRNAIAQTGQRLNIISDSRMRFERGVDPELVEYAQKKAAQLIHKYGGGTIGLAVTQGNKPLNELTITLPIEKVAQVTGQSYSKETIKDILQKLHCKIMKDEKDFLDVRTPSFRHDLGESIDLVEEILRLAGFDDVPALYLPTVIQSKSLVLQDQLIRKAMCQKGFHEAISFSFTSENVVKNFLFDPQVLNALEIKNPISADLSMMRPSVLCTLLQGVQRNIARKQSNLSFFEIGPQFNMKAEQENMLTALRTGRRQDKHWLLKDDKFNIYDIKQDLAFLLSSLGLSDQSYQLNQDDKPAYYHPGRSASLKQGPKTLAYFGELHPLVLKNLDIGQDVIAFEVFLDRIPGQKIKKAEFTPLSPFPLVKRDFSFILDEKVEAQTLLKAVLKVDKNLIQSVQIFDVYKGPNLPEGQKSITFEVSLQSMTETLKEETIQEISQKIISSVENATKGTLRQI